MKKLKFRTLENGKLRYQLVNSPTSIDTYTGTEDANGDAIYTNDLVKLFPNSESIWLVIYDNDSKGYRCLDRATTDLIKIPLLSSYTIVGNIHNP